MKLSSCGRLTLRPLTGPWCRLIKRQHWKGRLSARHSRTSRGRYNAGSAEEPAFQILYLAQVYQAALFEVGALLGDADRPLKNSADRAVWLTMMRDVTLQRVAELSEPEQQRLVGTSTQELTGHWKQYPPSDPAPTQRLGRALFDVPGLEGFLAPSAARPGATNLIVFPEKLQRGSRIDFFNEQSGRRERLKP